MATTLGPEDRQVFFRVLEYEILGASGSPIVNKPQSIHTQANIQQFLADLGAHWSGRIVNETPEDMDLNETARNTIQNMQTIRSSQQESSERQRSKFKHIRQSQGSFGQGSSPSSQSQMDFATQIPLATEFDLQRAASQSNIDTSRVGKGINIAPPTEVGTSHGTFATSPNSLRPRENNLMMLSRPSARPSQNPQKSDTSPPKVNVLNFLATGGVRANKQNISLPRSNVVSPVPRENLPVNRLVTSHEVIPSRAITNAAATSSPKHINSSDPKQTNRTVDAHLSASGDNMSSHSLSDAQERKTDTSTAHKKLNVVQSLHPRGNVESNVQDPWRAWPVSFNSFQVNSVLTHI